MVADAEIHTQAPGRAQEVQREKMDYMSKGYKNHKEEITETAYWSSWKFMDSGLTSWETTIDKIYFLYLFLMSDLRYIM